jgi:hypothetical protein
MAKAKTDKTRMVEVRAPEEWYSRVAAEADRLGLPVSTFIRVAVNDWLDRKSAERPSPAQGRQEPPGEQYAQIQILGSGNVGEGEERLAKIVFLPPAPKGDIPSEPSSQQLADTVETRPNRAKSRTEKKPPTKH